ncbi:TonB-dependent receptor [Roseivirga sp. BDSF3-8]|uniref:TonB-dependent receptor n=1 Tax=Roseivirga sp. BDSF3-8 TaxID=3241598 RepID=UPI0035328080
MASDFFKPATLCFLALQPLFLLLSGEVWAQSNDCQKDCSCSFTGRVIDKQTGDPLVLATVRVNNDKGATTDENGYFDLSGLCQEEFDLEVSYLGYKKLVHHHHVHHDPPTIFLSPDDQMLESVLVEEKLAISGEMTQSETTLERADPSLVGTVSLGQALKELPGVGTLKTGQNVVKPVVHGLHSNRLVIINNGLRHGNQNWGTEHAPEIDPDMAETFTVVKGAGAVKYGPEALGGVIIVEPPSPDLLGHLHGETELTGYSNGRGLKGRMLLSKGYTDFAWQVQASGVYQGDLETPDYMLTNTGMREQSVGATTVYHKRHFDASLSYSYTGQELGILRGSVTGNLADLGVALESEPPEGTRDFSYEIRNPRQETAHHLVRLSASYDLPKGLLDLTYGFQYNERREFDVRRGTNNERPSIDLALTTHSLDLEWQHPAWQGLSGSVGFQGEYQDNNNIPGTNTIPFVPNYNHTRWGFYVSEAKDFAGFTVEAGVRLDGILSSVRGRDNRNDLYTNDYQYTNISASLGMVKELSSRITYRSHLGLAWRPPSIAELYSFGKHQFVIEYGLWRYRDGITTVFDEDTREVPAEKGYKWVHSLDYENQGWRLGTTVFANYIQDFIYSRPEGITNTVRGAFPYFVYEQTNAVMAGADFSAFYTGVKKRWNHRVLLSLLYGRDVADDAYFVGLPPQRIGYRIQYTLPSLGPLQDLKAGMENEYSFRQFMAPEVIPVERFMGDDAIGTVGSVFDFLEAPDGYLLTDIYISAALRSFEFRFRVENVLNTEYRDYTNRLRYFADEPGRNFLISVFYQF